MRFNFHYVLLASLTGLAAGCNPNTGPGYPTAPPGSKIVSTAMPAGTSAMPATGPTAVKVPADAAELSSGAYPPPSFPAPTQPGLIEVVDLDVDPTVAVATTAVTGTGGDATKTMSITDVMNMAPSLNKNHKYRIVFVPTKPGSPTP